MVTISSNKTVFSDIFDGGEPNCRLLVECWKCGQMTDANNRGLHFISQWHIKCLKIFGN